MSSFSSLAARKLAALQANSARRQAAAAANSSSEADSDDDAPAVLAGSGESEPARKKAKGAADGSDAPAALPAGVVSDASAEEEAALAAMLGRGGGGGPAGASVPVSFGAAPKAAPDLSLAHAARVRREEAPAAQPLVKQEGAPAPASSSTAPRAPKKLAPAPAPAAPALLGGMYDSSDDESDEEEGDGAGKSSAAAAGSRLGASSSASARAGWSASARAASADGEDDEEEEDDAEEAENDPAAELRRALQRSLPISHEAVMATNGHTKSVSALALDKAGGRVLSGGYDYQVKMWDFGGMNESMAAFRTFEPQEGHQVRQIAYSHAGAEFLVVTGGAQPKVYARDGAETCQLARGDMYLLDQKRTKGHSSAVTSGWWHPTSRTHLLTSGIDGTMRVWDVNRPAENVSVMKPRGIQRGVAVSATAFSRDGRTIAAACSDGSIHLMQPGKGWEYRDDKSVLNAHVKGSSTTSLLLASDGWSLLSRGGEGDDTLKLWDTRAFRQPLHVLAGLPNAYPETDLALSPDESVIVTGTSSREVHSLAEAGHAHAAEGVGGHSGATGEALFIERSTLRVLQRVSLGGGRAVVRSAWHPLLNQVLFGCSDGAIRLLYDPQRSTKGALLCVGRKAKPKPLSDYSESVGAIITPHAMPSMRGDGAAAVGSRKRAREKAAAALAPEAPIAGRHGVGGRPAGSQSLTAYHLSQHLTATRQDPRAMDPRAALLAMEEKVLAEGAIFTSAYQKTQPKPIFAEVPDEERTVELTEEEIALYNKREGQTK